MTERGEASEDEDEALAVIRDIKEAGVSPTVASKLDDLARTLTGPRRIDRSGKTVKPRRQFGAFAGRFTVGPEFFEPLSEAELRSWGEG